MVGGARNGYCSKLSPVSEKTPSSTIRIAMTIATIGRRMKNSATAQPWAARAVMRPARRRRFSSGLTCMPGRTFCEALDDDALARA